MAGPLEPFIPRGRPERPRGAAQRTKPDFRNFVTWANTQTVACRRWLFPEKHCTYARERENVARARSLSANHTLTIEPSQES